VTSGSEEGGRERGEAGGEGGERRKAGGEFEKKKGGGSPFGGVETLMKSEGSERHGSAWNHPDMRTFTTLIDALGSMEIWNRF